MSSIDNTGRAGWLALPIHFMLTCLLHVFPYCPLQPVAHEGRLSRRCSCRSSTAHVTPGYTVSKMLWSEIALAAITRLSSTTCRTFSMHTTQAQRAPLVAARQAMRQLVADLHTGSTYPILYDCSNRNAATLKGISRANSAGQTQLIAPGDNARQTESKLTLSQQLRSSTLRAYYLMSAPHLHQ